MAKDEMMGMEMGSGSSDEEESGSDFDVAADAVAMELGAEPTPALRSALREMVMACMSEGYGSDKPAEKEDGGLALIFGGPKGK